MVTVVPGAALAEDPVPRRRDRGVRHGVHRARELGARGGRGERTCGGERRRREHGRDRRPRSRHAGPTRRATPCHLRGKGRRRVPSRTGPREPSPARHGSQQVALADDRHDHHDERQRAGPSRTAVSRRRRSAASSSTGAGRAAVARHAATCTFPVLTVLSQVAAGPAGLGDVGGERDRAQQRPVPDEEQQHPAQRPEGAQPCPGGRPPRRPACTPRSRGTRRARAGAARARVQSQPTASHTAADELTRRAGRQHPRHHRPG